MSGANALDDIAKDSIKSRPTDLTRGVRCSVAGVASSWVLGNPGQQCPDLKRHRGGSLVSQGDYLFTSESVSEGHPDKVADRISDAVVDAYMTLDPQSRVGVETLVTTNRIIMAGEVRGPFEIDKQDLENIARHCVKDIGYEQEGFHWKHARVEVLIHNQSADIAVGVDGAGNKAEGAGDQGIMFGYACRETDALMPAPIHYSHAILRSLAEARHSGAAPGLGPDSKSQITLLYSDGKPAKATSVVVSTQHDPELDQDQVRKIVRPHVENTLPEGWMCPDDKFYVNPTGRFVIGGPDSDCGLTGRKIIVDTYGGSSPHGGGAFSGKDPSKVDRSAAYAARYLARNIIAAGLAERCVIQISYAIGVAKPLSVYVHTYGTGSKDDGKLAAAISEVMDLTPRGIRDHLGLDKPIYARTAAYGHFGRTPDEDGGFSWERDDLVDDLISALT